MVTYLPINLKLNRQPVLVVGGGQVAYRKIKLLLEAKAVVTVVAPKVDQLIRDLSAITIIERVFQDRDIKGHCLIFAATNDQRLNQHIAELGQGHHILVNVVDDPSNCDFIMPSIIRRGPLAISISTAGQAPILSRTIAKQLSDQFDQDYGNYVSLIAKIRQLLYQKITEPAKRLAIMEQVIQANLLKQLNNNHLPSPETIVQELLKNEG